jgi:ribonuclease HII
LEIDTMAVSRFKFEREFLAKGISRIAGADEAGRGPLAGPVTAAVVCFPSDWIRLGLPRKLRGLNDSKQLNEEERVRFYDFLTCSAEVSFGIATVDVETIDSINILRASLLAMEKALSQLIPLPEHALVDGPHIFSFTCPQTPLVDGDARSFSIAAASVLAKVTRDRMMLEYDAQFPEYGFGRHKGYSTPEHLKALKDFGPCPIHRKSFAPIRPPVVHPELFSDPSFAMKQRP